MLSDHAENKIEKILKTHWFTVFYVRGGKNGKFGKWFFFNLKPLFPWLTQLRLCYVDVELGFWQHKQTKRYTRKKTKLHHHFLSCFSQLKSYDDVSIIYYFPMLPDNIWQGRAKTKLSTFLVSYTGHNDWYSRYILPYHIYFVYHLSFKLLQLILMSLWGKIQNS